MDGIYEQARAAALELCEQSGIGEGDVAVIGCSTSVVLGKKKNGHERLCRHRKVDL